MSRIGSEAQNMSSHLERQTDSIKQKVAGVNRVWSGEAQKSFNEVHQEAMREASRAKSQLESIKSLARSLDSSIESAKREKAAKKAAQKH